MNISDDMEVAYTPSMFSKRFENRDILINHYIDFSQKESEKSRAKYDCHLNIAYGETARQKLDIYGDNLRPDSPLFVFVHGGYWQMCDKWSSSFFVGPLVDKGIRVIVIGYDLCPIVTLAQLIEQIKRSLAWVSDYIAKNSITSVSFAGHSAGAHLLACVLTKEFINSIADEVKLFAYFISGIYDLEELYLTKAANENDILSLDETSAHDLSPQFYDFTHFNEGRVNSFVWVGEHESPKFKEQSDNFAKITLKGNQDVAHEVVAEVDHFDIIENLSAADDHLTQRIINNSILT